MALPKHQQLFIAGVGVKSLAHLTTEARDLITKCDRVLYLLNEPLLKDYVQENARSSFDLESVYFQYNDRNEAYQQIADFILAELNQYETVGVLCYGHPFFCASPLLDAAKRVQSQGMLVHSMPAVSSLDCLLSDLFIDPTVEGLSVIEASSLLHARKKIDTSSHTVLLQVGFVNVTSHTHEDHSNPGFEALAKYLCTFYPKGHLVTLYEASLYPLVEPVIMTKPLAMLEEFTLSALSSFYLPPLG